MKSIADRIRDERISRLEKKVDSILESLRSESHLENYDRAVVESTRTDLSSLKDAFNDTIGGVLQELDTRVKENSHTADQLKLQCAEFTEHIEKMKTLKNTVMEKIIFPVLTAVVTSILYQVFAWYVSTQNPSTSVNGNNARPQFIQTVLEQNASGGATK